MPSPTAPLPLSPSGLLAMPPITVAHISLLFRSPGIFRDAPSRTRAQ